MLYELHDGAIRDSTYSLVPMFDDGICRVDYGSVHIKENAIEHVGLCRCGESSFGYTSV